MSFIHLWDPFLKGFLQNRFQSWVFLWVSFNYEIEVIDWVVSEFLGLCWVDLHVIQLVYDNCLWFGLIEEYDPPSLTLGSDLDLCCLVIIQLSWLLIRLPSYGAIMIKLIWIIGLSC